MLLINYAYIVMHFLQWVAGVRKWILWINSHQLFRASLINDRNHKLCLGTHLDHPPHLFNASFIGSSCCRNQLKMYHFLRPIKLESSILNSYLV